MEPAVSFDVEVNDEKFTITPFRGVDSTSFVPFVGMQTVIDGEVKTLKVQYNMEFSKDPKDMHSLDAEKEFFDFIKIEVVEELRRYLDK